NSNSLVVIGEKYHYIFQVDKNLVRIFKASRSISFAPIFFAFYVDKDNKVSGSFVLKVESATLTNDEMSLLTGLGFRDIKVSKNAELRYDAAIKGQRYVVSDSFNNIEKFEHTYQIKVFVPYSDDELAAKAVLSPVTVATDAMLVIPLGILHGVFQIFNQP
ncbi:MAG TPA: hypothetical protein VIQ03_08345, partial [Gammaproteobacteria bacterium]